MLESVTKDILTLLSTARINCVVSMTPNYSTFFQPYFARFAALARHIM